MADSSKFEKSVNDKSDLCTGINQQTDPIMGNQLRH
jgi:hypothetical protein